MKKIIERIITIGLYVGFFLVLFVCLSEKKNFHTDEISTYILSNNTYDDTIIINPVRGEIYENPEEAFLQSMTVKSGEQFNYPNVWAKQKADVHPPLYYAMVHTISSLFPNTFSVWFAGIINVIFAMLTLFVLRKTVRELTAKKELVFLASCCYVFSAGILSATTFLRMYIVAMFFTTLITYLFIKNVANRQRYFYPAIGAVSVLGALTHYYFVIYLLFICLVYGIGLIIKKSGKDILYFILTMGIAGLVSILIFPPMLTHTLGGGYRGTETLNNLSNSSFSQFISKLKACYNMVDSQLFGGLFLLLILLAIILLLIGYMLRKRGKNGFSFTINSTKVIRWGLVVIPAVAYFILVSKIAVYTTDRYFHPIYPMLIIAVVGIIGIITEKMVSEKIAFFTLGALFIITTFKDFSHNFFYLYRSTQSFIDTAKQYDNTDCIYFVNQGYEINPSFLELREYNRIVFVDYNNPEMLSDIDYDAKDGLIVSMGTACDFNSVSDAVTKRFPHLRFSHKLGEYSFSATYYFDTQ